MKYVKTCVHQSFKTASLVLVLEGEVCCFGGSFFWFLVVFFFLFVCLGWVVFVGFLFVCLLCLFVFCRGLVFSPYGVGKNPPILQTRYFSFKGWVFLWLFVFHIAVKLERRAVRTRACIAGCKMMKMAVKIVQLSSKVQFSSWSCVIWIWSSLRALQHKLNTREGNQASNLWS